MVQILAHNFPINLSFQINLKSYPLRVISVLLSNFFLQTFFVSVWLQHSWMNQFNLGTVGTCDRNQSSSNLWYDKHDTITFSLTVYCTIKCFLNQVFNKLIKLLSESEACQGSVYILINRHETHSSIITHGSLIRAGVIWLTEGAIIVISLKCLHFTEMKIRVLQ